MIRKNYISHYSSYYSKHFSPYEQSNISNLSVSRLLVFRKKVCALNNWKNGYPTLLVSLLSFDAKCFGFYLKKNWNFIQIQPFIRPFNTKNSDWNAAKVLLNIGVEKQFENWIFYEYYYYYKSNNNTVFPNKKTIVIFFLFRNPFRHWTKWSREKM